MTLFWCGFNILWIGAIHFMDHRSYDQLEIKSGDTAIVKYWQLIHSLDESEHQKIISELKQYCHQDTLAMVKIYEALKNLT